MLQKHFMLRKLSECIKNPFYAKIYTSRSHITKIAVRFSKMASPDQIWYRESLTTPIVAKGLIDGLPFTSEGYARAKLILPSRYDKPREAAAAHIYCVTLFTCITNCTPNRIQEFCEKLTISVQALETMKNLKDIKGYARLTLDKLPGIRADILRLDDN